MQDLVLKWADMSAATVRTSTVRFPNSSTCEYNGSLAGNDEPLRVGAGFGH